MAWRTFTVCVCEGWGFRAYTSMYVQLNGLIHSYSAYVAWQLIPDVIGCISSRQSERMHSNPEHVFVLNDAEGARWNNFFVLNLHQFHMSSEDSQKDVFLLCVCCCYAMLIPLQVYHDDVFTGLHCGHQLLFIPDVSYLNTCLSVWWNFGDRVQFDRHWKFVLINTNLNLNFNQKPKRQFFNNYRLEAVQFSL